jgi:hypothetical protein
MREWVWLGRLWLVNEGGKSWRIALKVKSERNIEMETGLYWWKRKQELHTTLQINTKEVEDQRLLEKSRTPSYIAYLVTKNGTVPNQKENCVCQNGPCQATSG